MAIDPICDMSEYDFGGLLFSPPEDNKVRKFHLCRQCYDEITASFQK